ncbi:tRNA pseudouridine(38-40) synthase TruA [Lacibacter sp. MH-610]|uniref:tRNA pseudouridine(38-40) synthase TruA n=1 Tax=Lacibacter sp. MH-610 TaxID=3020883 RepID=UPI0038918644
MPRYFLELAYKGERYSGFQVQENAVTVQSEVQKAFQVFYRKEVELTGSSRTDAGVHALQNYFHFDWDGEVLEKHLYNINAILPGDIVLRSVKQVAPEAHSRFNATSREYKYYIYFEKNPFLEDRAWFFPYKLDLELLHQTAAIIKSNTHFLSFSRQNTQVKTFDCTIMESYWIQEQEMLVYNVKANRFVRGMVRALVSSMMQVARGNRSITDFQRLFTDPKQASADFSAPAKGLFLCKVNYPDAQFSK